MGKHGHHGDKSPRSKAPTSQRTPKCKARNMECGNLSRPPDGKARASRRQVAAFQSADKSAHSKKDRRSGMQRASKTPGKVLNSREFKMETKSLRLLIVDDEEAARYGVRRALEAFGCEIAEADSAEKARALTSES